MTDLRTAAQQALEALEEFGTHYEYCPRYPTWARPELQPPCNCGLDSNVVALRAALAQQDEPKGGGNLPPPLQAEPVQDQDDILRMAREAGLQQRHATPTEWWCWEGSIERFFALAAAAQREKLAHWMRSISYATGHGDTMEEMLDHLGTQISEGLEVEALTEREACAKVCQEISKEYGLREGGRLTVLRTDAESGANDCAAAIRARSKT